MDADKANAAERGFLAVRRRSAWIIGVVLAGLALTIAVPMALVSLVPNYDPGPPPDTVLSDGGVLPAETTTVSLTSTFVPSVTGAATSRAASTAASKAPPSAVRPVSTTYEAEAAANTLGGSAWVTQYPDASGGRIVRNMGDWDSVRGPGWLRFNDVTVASDGTYTLTMYTTHLDAESTRTVVVAVGGGARGTVTVRGDSRCCSATAVRVSLKQGRNTIGFSNPNDHAPSLDRIVVSAP